MKAFASNIQLFGETGTVNIYMDDVYGSLDETYAGHGKKVDKFVAEYLNDMQSELSDAGVNEDEIESARIELTHRVSAYIYDNGFDVYYTVRFFNGKEDGELKFNDLESARKAFDETRARLEQIDRSYRVLLGEHRSGAYHHIAIDGGAK